MLNQVVFAVRTGLGMPPISHMLLPYRGLTISGRQKPTFSMLTLKPELEPAVSISVLSEARLPKSTKKSKKI
jgi:hypothetical protein